MNHKTTTLVSAVFWASLLSAQFSFAVANTSSQGEQTATNSNASLPSEVQPDSLNAETNQLQNPPAQNQSGEVKLVETEKQEPTIDPVLIDTFQEFTNTLALSIRAECSNRVAVALQHSQDEQDARYAVLCSAHEGCCGKALWWMWGILFGVICIFFIPVSIKICRKQDVNRNIEVLMLLAVLLLISFGAYQLTSRIVDAGTKSHLEEIAQAPNKPSAVLCAYKQLSDEMERWFALFAVLGAFFGLVLPVGTYLLQIKGIDRHEKEMKQDIKDEVAREKENLIHAREEEISKTKETIAGAKNRLEILERKVEEDKKEIELFFASMKSIVQETNTSLLATSSKVQEMGASLEKEISKLWRKQGNNAHLMLSLELKNVLLADSNGKKDSRSDLAVLYWSITWNQCAWNSKSREVLEKSVKVVCHVFKQLREKLSESGWNSFIDSTKRWVQMQDGDVVFYCENSEKDNENYKKFFNLLEEIGIKVIDPEWELPQAE